MAGLPENSSDNVFFFFFFSPHLFVLQFYRGLSMVYFKENYNFPRFQRRSNILQGGGVTFSRGSNFFQEGLNTYLYRNP